MIDDEIWWADHCEAILERVKAKGVFKDKKINTIVADVIATELQIEVKKVKEEMMNLLKQI